MRNCAVRRKLRGADSKPPKASKPKVHHCLGSSAISILVISTLQLCSGGGLPATGDPSACNGISTTAAPEASYLRSHLIFRVITLLGISSADVRRLHLHQSSKLGARETCSLLQVATRPLISTPGYPPRFLIPISVSFGCERYSSMRDSSPGAGPNSSNQRRKLAGQSSSQNHRISADTNMGLSLPSMSSSVGPSLLLLLPKHAA